MTDTMTREEANAKLAEVTEAARALLASARKIAEEHELEFTWPVDGYDTTINEQWESSDDWWNSSDISC